jgi:predicted transcriptional regulator
LTDSVDSQKEVFGLLTDIFDGYVKIPYGNNQVREFYDLYFNMVAGVTDIVHSHSAASIGERFLRIDFLGRNYDSREFARRALQNFGKAKPQKELLMRNTLGFVNHLKSMPINMTLQDEYLDPLTDLAEFIATIRTKVESDAKEGIKYTPRAELPSRLASQLAKLFVSTRGVYILEPDNDESLDISSKYAFETTKKVALDTCYGFSLDIVRTIKKYPLIDRTTIAEKSGIHQQRAYRVLQDLCTTGVLTKCSGRVGASGGRPAHYYAINPKLEAVLSYDCKESPKPGKPKRPTSGPGRKR